MLENNSKLLNWEKKNWYISEKIESLKCLLMLSMNWMKYNDVTIIQVW